MTQDKPGSDGDVLTTDGWACRREAGELIGQFFGGARGGGGAGAQPTGEHSGVGDGIKIVQFPNEPAAPNFVEASTAAVAKQLESFPKYVPQELFFEFMDFTKETMFAMLDRIKKLEDRMEKLDPITPMTKLDIQIAYQRNLVHKENCELIELEAQRARERG